ncbi:transporter substrate-binding domain-containing protein [Vibrio sp. SCSIO 43136]|uniref:substrate-binding periplasmic protein n=1 Tax=Vibrio sp. SCSIO 43136 TaxID=2819101 RepID=UPI002075FED3|nr:transporter substrate-binding domain-containing protein [Vibrio sp. SCSIO 43136]USD66933.1 ABC transporter substrate-binding protein [Vibrio sp. SCSIO 43136]
MTFHWLRRVIAFTIGALSFLSLPASANLQIFTEQFPPYNYREVNQPPEGIAVDLLLTAAENVGRDIKREDILVRPWPRAYRAVRIEPNTILFSMGRTAKRENMFKWVGPIGETRVVLLARKDSKISINSGEELKNYTIGVILDDVGEQLIIEEGANIARLERATTAVSLARMLDLGRIDLWAYEESVARWSISKAHLNNELFEVVYVLNELPMYYAFNPETDPVLIADLQRGVDMAKEVNKSTGMSQLDEIRVRYGVE